MRYECIPLNKILLLQPVHDDMRRFGDLVLLAKIVMRCALNAVKFLVIVGYRLKDPRCMRRCAGIVGAVLDDQNRNLDARGAGGTIGWLPRPPPLSPIYDPPNWMTSASFP